MNCEETLRLLEAHADGELDLPHHAAVAAHLRECAACTGRHEAVLLRRETLRQHLPRYTAPAGLEARIRAARPATAENPVAAFRSARRFPPLWQLGGVAAGLAIALVAGFAWGGARARDGLLFDEAVAEHVRSLQVDHLTDVRSTDRHTVKPWFAGKLDFSPPVVDLATEGFPLSGGRLEHLAGRPAAALVFLRRQHAINLYVWRADGRGVAARNLSRAGFQAQAWSDRDFNYLAVSEIPADELAHFAAAFRAAAPCGPGDGPGPVS